MEEREKRGTVPFFAHISAFDGEGGSEWQKESIVLNGKFVGALAGSRSGWSEKYVAGYVAKCYTILKIWQLLS